MNTFETVWQNRTKFFLVFFIVVTLTYTLLVAIDFVPEPVSDSESEESAPVERAIAAETVSENEETVEEDIAASDIDVDEMNSGDTVDTGVSLTANTQPETRIPQESLLQESVMPLEISIPKLGRTVTVLNPTSRSIEDLDAALLEGVVRHPDSATLNQQGNVFILGHSSYLPNVFNRNFQAFNGLQDLAWGDTIEIASEDMVFEYRVDKVYKADASDTTVPIAGEGHRLILATCNSFGSVDDRFIVEAKRIGVREL
jgi:LPXTG-site transpeptidase (sortase) family protein